MQIELVELPGSSRTPRLDGLFAGAAQGVESRRESKPASTRTTAR